jgi:hypothetical protein
MVAGGLIAGPEAGIRLAAVGLAENAPPTGVSCRTSAWLIRVGRIAPWPKRSDGTPTTALVTFTFLYTVMFVVLMVVARLTTTLLTTRGPPQPPHHATPTKPGRPHHGMSGSPQPSGAQQTGRPTLVTAPPPRKTMSAGAYAGRTTRGPGAQPQELLTKTQRP